MFHLFLRACKDLLVLKSISISRSMWLQLNPDLLLLIAAAPPHIFAFALQRPGGSVLIELAALHLPADILNQAGRQIDTSPCDLRQCALLALSGRPVTKRSPEPPTLSLTGHEGLYELSLTPTFSLSPLNPWRPCDSWNVLTSNAPCLHCFVNSSRDSSNSTLS